MYKVLSVDNEFVARDGLFSSDWSRLEKLLKHSLPIAIHTFWKELTNGNFDEVEIVEKMNLLRISFQSSYFACAIFNIETPRTSKPKIISKQVFPNILYDRLEGYLNVHHLGYFFINEKNELIFILNFNCSNPSETPYDNLSKIINDIDTIICGSYGASGTLENLAGVGNIFSNIYQVSLSYSQAKESLKRTFFNDKGHIIYSWEQAAICMQAPVQYPYERENDLINAILECDKAKALEKLNAFFREFNTGIYIESGLIKMMTLELLLVLERKLRKYGISIEGLLMDCPSLVTYIEGQKTFRDLMESVANLIENIVIALSNNKESVKTSSHAAIQQTITYIQNHFHEKLTLSHVAQKAYLNPCYFSIQFKKETGMNFVDFLKAIRINKAKELLKRIDLKVSEIAKTVGFQNKQYFSDAFKRYTGQTPLEYRQQLIFITPVDCAFKEGDTSKRQHVL